jgi:hypothetical protein
MIQPPWKPIQFDQPAMYKIVVQGRIDPAMSDRLEGMAILGGTLNKNNSLTTLEGELIDQAALAGVLNTLYELHLLVLSVECIYLRCKEKSTAGELEQ